jgi:hypothetical protein
MKGLVSSNSHLREIDGLKQCTSCCRIDSPSFVEKTCNGALDECISLHMVSIRAGCGMRINEGLREFNPFLVSEDDDLKEGRS